MEKDLFDSIPDKKLYHETSIRVGTLLGGPLIAGYLIAENYRQLGEFDKVKTTWLYATGATILIFGAVFFIPGIEKIPNYIIPIIYSGIAPLLFQKYQGDQVKSHIKNGGQLYSTWRAVLASLIGLMAMAIIVMVLLFLTDPSVFQQL